MAYDKSASDCSAARARARADAAKLLQGKTTPNGLSSGAFIDQILADMDQYVAWLPTTQETHMGTQAAVLGIPVTIEDEVQPTYARYDDCLKAQVSNSRLAPDTIIATFKLAMTLCAGVRELEVKEAKQALVAKGWDDAKRVRAAENTFSKADESWLAMGRQYHEALRMRVAQAVKASVPAPKAKVPAKRKRTD